TQGHVQLGYCSDAVQRRSVVQSVLQCAVAAVMSHFYTTATFKHISAAPRFTTAHNPAASIAATSHTGTAALIPSLQFRCGKISVHWCRPRHYWPSIGCDRGLYRGLRKRLFRTE